MYGYSIVKDRDSQIS